jgi:hypothetical protein
VEFHVADSYQHRLRDVKSEPTGEKDGMHPQQNRASGVAVYEFVFNGLAEPANNDRRYEQRHTQIEILLYPS